MHLCRRAPASEHRTTYPPRGWYADRAVVEVEHSPIAVCVRLINGPLWRCIGIKVVAENHRSSRGAVIVPNRYSSVRGRTRNITRTCGQLDRNYATLISNIVVDGNDIHGNRLHTSRNDGADSNGLEIYPGFYSV